MIGVAKGEHMYTPRAAAAGSPALVPPTVPAAGPGVSAGERFLCMPLHVRIHAVSEEYTPYLYDVSYRKGFVETLTIGVSAGGFEGGGIDEDDGSEEEEEEEMPEDLAGLSPEGEPSHQANSSHIHRLEFSTHERSE